MRLWVKSGLERDKRGGLPTDNPHTPSNYAIPMRPIFEKFCFSGKPFSWSSLNHQGHRKEWAIKAKIFLKDIQEKYRPGLRPRRLFGRSQRSASLGGADPFFTTAICNTAWLIPGESLASIYQGS